jgi:RimJ/RimL family protein N-acetyltransferase
LLLRRPRADDADAIFVRYASDPNVTRFVGWPRHTSPTETRTFVAFSDAEWTRAPAGPYLMCSRVDGSLLGSTGLLFETPSRAQTGYVLATDAWGKGYASEGVRAMVDIARAAGVRRLYALCHVDHRASWRVLEKCGFLREGVLRQHDEFPNLDPPQLCDVLCYALIL